MQTENVTQVEVPESATTKALKTLELIEKLTTNIEVVKKPRKQMTPEAKAAAAKKRADTIAAKNASK